MPATAGHRVKHLVGAHEARDVSLHDVIATVEGRELTLEIQAPEEASSLVAEVAEYLETQSVSVIHTQTGTEQGAVLREHGEQLVDVPIDALRALVDPQIVRQLGETVPYEPLLEELSETTFSSYDRSQMLRTSREIEDRAWRQGFGRLYAGFQRLSVFEAQEEVYSQLAESNLDVHVFGDPDIQPPAGEFTVHTSAAEEVTPYWFVVYDGGDRRTQASALLAEEREANEYYGFWTYDPALVGEILEALPVATEPLPDR